MKTATRLTQLRSVLTALIILFGAHSYSSAQGGCDDTCAPPNVVPEIDPSLSTGGLALLGGAILLVRGRRRQ